MMVKTRNQANDSSNSTDIIASIVHLLPLPPSPLATIVHPLPIPSVKYAPDGKDHAQLRPFPLSFTPVKCSPNGQVHAELDCQ